MNQHRTTVGVLDQFEQTRLIFSANASPHPLLPLSAIFCLSSFPAQMNVRSSMCGADCRRLILVAIFADLVFQALSDDAKYEACAPQSCGYGSSISYPFWISGVQESYCGYPNFEVSCKGNYPVLNISGSEFFIRNIFPSNHSFVLVSGLVYEDSCAAPLHNISLERMPFNLSSSNSYLLFYYNCTSQPTGFTYPVECATDPTLHSFAIFLADTVQETDWSTAISSCDSPVSVPVDVNADINSLSAVNYTDIIEMGFLLNWTAMNCSDCEESQGRCGFENNKFVCFCQDGPHARTCNDGRPGLLGRKAIIGIAASAAGIGIALIFMLSFWKKPKVRIIMTLIKQRTIQFDGEMKIEGLVSLRRYTYKDIKTITNSFKEKLGQGGYGSVYKGKLRDGQLVAVKLLKQLKGDAEEFFNEVTSISRTSHVNVVSLVGFCLEGSKRALVYEFMPNGSLEKFIFNKSNTLEVDRQLKWDTLYQISLGIAHGLEYLHQGCNTRILHFDIKPHNILLDANYCPKISDFGLAKICSRQESIVSMLGPRGTPGYIAPELIIRNIGGVSHKSDVYSYGMMVLEMVGKRKNIEIAVDRTSETYFPHWVHRRLELQEDLGLRGITNEEDEIIAKKMIIVGLWCIQIHPRSRPSISQVVEMLKGSIDALQVPPKPSLSSPSRSPMASPCESSSLLDRDALSWGHSISIVREQYSL